jgi:hypothetical protein
MRNVIFAFLVFIVGCGHTKKAQNTETPATDTTVKQAEQQVSISPDTISLRQIDGTVIDIIGAGNMNLSYTETTDGYTIILNGQGLYEYAKQAKDGDLIPTGVRAHNPDKREKSEIKFLSKKPKHLRYQNPRLNEILERKERLYKNYQKMPKK